jgi:NADPH-dependent 7-cyano-7-deazaguanine reductase QueF-like protein
MRISIVTLPRTGGTSFTRWLGKELNYKTIYEPYWSNHFDRKIKYTDSELWEQPNTLTKWILDEFEYLDNGINYYLASYDFVILHTRDDVYAESKSFTYALNSFNSSGWHMQYVIPPDWETLNKDSIEEITNKLSVDKSKLLSLTGNINTTYEGLYYGDDSKRISDLLNFTPKYLNMIDCGNKYQIRHKTHKTLL